MSTMKPTYQPDIEVARKAPAVICAVASRTHRLRIKLAELKTRKPPYSLHDVEQLTRDFIAPLPFEAELLSGEMAKVDQAIREMNTTEPTQ